MTTKIDRTKANAFRLAVDFSRRLRNEVGLAVTNEIVRRNAREPNPSVCHSHDFCDPNQLMLDAGAWLGLGDMAEDQHHALVNAAWGVAQSNRFFLDGLLF